MKAITLRNVPLPVARAIKEKAKRERLSLNRAVVGLLEEATAQPKSKARAPNKALHYDLDKYAGAWTKEEAEEFNADLKEQRRVNPEDWE